MAQNYIELEHYIRYEISFWKFKVWICFGKKEAIEAKVSKKVQIIFFFTTKKKKYLKDVVLMK